MMGQSKSNKAEGVLPPSAGDVHRLQDRERWTFFFSITDLPTTYPFGSVLVFTRSLCANIHIVSCNDHENGYSGEKQQNTPGYSIL